MWMRWESVARGDCDRVGAAGRRVPENSPEGGVKSTRFFCRFAVVDQNPACVPDSAPGSHE